MNYYSHLKITQLRQEELRTQAQAQQLGKQMMWHASKPHKISMMKRFILMIITMMKR